MSDGVPASATLTASAKIPFVVTVDVEPDDAWSNHLNESVRNVQELERLQNLLDEFGARATLLVTYRVLQDPKALSLVRKLQAKAQAEVGAHLHPWENPPFLETGEDVRYPSYPHELPLAMFQSKMQLLTQRITETVGAPTSYRAGRWGLAAEHLRILEQMGYEVDTSVLPLVDWRPTLGIPRSRNGHGGPDYRFAPQCPYRPDYSDMTRLGEARIIEMPVTVAFTRRVPRLIRRSYGRIPLIVRRVLRKSELVRPVWANPAEQPKDRLIRMMSVVLRERCELINVAFHSSELMLGGSPSSRTQHDVDQIFERLREMLRLAQKSGICRFCTLTEAAHYWSAGQANGNGIKSR